jgi:cyclopropane fatty-acyl-phospholipid synthase-like methyltransferase
MLRFKTMIDVGCGPGGMVELARKHDVKAIGIDGDPAVIKTGIIKHDYTLGKLPALPGNFEFAWSVEFLEHVEAQYLPNIMDTFQRVKYVFCTHALPGETGGHHHVNLQPEEYWIQVFSDYGFKYHQPITEVARRESTMAKGFVGKTGKLFVRAK